MEQAPTLHRLVQDIGEPLLRLAVDPGGADQPLAGVAIHDPADAEGMEAGCLVLCVGVTRGQNCSPSAAPRSAPVRVASQ